MEAQAGSRLPLVWGVLFSVLCAGFAAFVLLPDIAYSEMFFGLPVLALWALKVAGLPGPELVRPEGLDAAQSGELNALERRWKLLLALLLPSMGVGMTTNWLRGLWGPYDRVAAVICVIGFIGSVVASLLLRRRWFAVIETPRPGGAPPATSSADGH